MTRRIAIFVALLALLPTAGALAVTPRASYSDVEDEVMCVTCNVPLGLAESPQAERQKAKLRELVAQGLTKQEIKDELVRQYGPNVLALPKSDGFGIAAYLVPILAGLAIIGLLATLLPRWRHRSRSQSPGASPQQLSSSDARRLDEDMAKFDL